MTAGRVSVYVHIPWCLSRCPYCDFNTYAAREWPEKEYADALLSELAWYLERPPFAGSTLATVFFGGGTPSLFAPQTIERLLDESCRRFRTASDLEITLEANPGTVDRVHLAGFRAAGVNRLSVGIQSFQPRLLESLGRRHSVGESRDALDAARAAGFERLSLDLMYAIPTQTLEELEIDLSEAIARAPEHISAYALIFEPGTPLTRDLQSGRIQRASEDLEAAMYETVGNRLGEAGWSQYEISNFARPGHEARHNQAYWRGGPYLGLGAGAHSFAPEASPVAPEARFGVRWQNVRDPAHYRDAVSNDGHAVAEHEALTRAQAMGEFCWLGLRETRGISEPHFRERFGTTLDDAFPHVQTLRREGLVTQETERVALTPRGRLLADEIFAGFF